MSAPILHPQNHTHGQVWTFLSPLCFSRLCRHKLCGEPNDLSHCRHGCFFSICHAKKEQNLIRVDAVSIYKTIASRYCTHHVQTFTLLCSHRMCATKASLELKTLLHSPHVYPEPGGLLRSPDGFVFLSGGGECFFCPLT